MTKTWVAGEDIGSSDAERWELAVSSTVRDKHAPALGVFFAEVYGADPTGAISAVAAINQCIADNGSVYLVGTYLIDGPILSQASNQKITLVAGAKLLITDGYAGDVIRVGGSASIRGVIIEGGGRIVEQGKSGGSATVPGAWTAVRFLGDGVGVTGCHVTGLQIDWAGIAVAWDASGAGWVNGCTVDNLKIMYPAVFFDITTPSINYDNNTIGPLMGQSGQYTTYGVRGINGDNWTFLNVALWDIANNPAGISSQILANARNVTIVGGFLTEQNFANAAAPDAVTIFDQKTVRPWIRPEFIRPSDCVARNIANKPTLTQTPEPGNWPYWSFADAVSSSVSFVWQLPAGFTQMELDLQLFDVSGLTGDVVLQATFSPAPNSGNSNSANIVVTNPAAGAETVGVITKSPLTDGALYRVYVTRLGADAADTLASAIGLLGVIVKPIQ